MALNIDRSLVVTPHRCRCATHSPLELRVHGGDLVMGRHCELCGVVYDVRARLQDWMAVQQLVSIVLDQALHTLL